jgi:hypothetical protein
VCERESCGFCANLRTSADWPLFSVVNTHVSGYQCRVRRGGRRDGLMARRRVRVSYGSQMQGQSHQCERAPLIFKAGGCRFNTATK